MSFSHYVTRVIELLGYYVIKQKIRMERKNEEFPAIGHICLGSFSWS